MKSLRQLVVFFLGIIFLVACSTSTLPTRSHKNFTSTDYAKLAEDYPAPKHIALLLPLSGPTAAQAQAILNGFLAAYYQNQSTQTVKIYDTASVSVLVQYQQAIQDGADFVVGPLTKTNVQLLLDKASIKIPTLALNYTLTEQSVPNKFYQFALSPENDAQAIAARAAQRGYHHAITLTPEGQWGANVVQAFNKPWLDQHGTIVAALAFRVDDGLNDSIASLLNADQSQERYDNLRWMLKDKLIFTPRRRQDVDVIFLNALPAQAQQILPLLRYYYAGNIPVYATSQIYNGMSMPSRDKDLDGIQFLIMPWAVNSTPTAQAMHSQLQNLWGANFKQYSLLYAYGIDAYNLVLHIPEFKNIADFNLIGNTGKLSLTQNNRFISELEWAKFENGVPVLITQ
ncbi:MAG: penicillin-binding protein activator [Gammaproteobacteria bacterium]|nr:penicillin-binding protein activator [Gammaproteobacteria bacterium]